MYSIEKNTEITNKHFKRRSPPLVIMKVLIKTSIQQKVKNYIVQNG